MTGMAVYRILLTFVMPSRNALVATLVCLLAGSFVMAEPPELVSSKLLDDVLADVRDGQLDECDLFHAALVMSGVDNESQLRAYEDQLGHFTRLVKEQTAQLSQEARCRELLQFLHEQLLVGDYDAGCSDVRRIFEDGSYNCVTATITFVAMSRRLGSSPLETEVVALPGHVRCQLVAGDEAVIIETTSSEWPSRVLQEHVGLQPRCLSDVQLLAKLVYNRGLQEIQQRAYESAIRSTELSWQLDKAHAAARENVAAAINNWSLELCGEGKFAKAIELLKQGSKVAPELSTLQSNQRHVYLRWISAAEAAGDSRSSLEVRAEARRQFPGDRWD